MMAPATHRLIVRLHVLLGLLTVCGEVTVSAGQEAPRFLTVAPGISHTTFDVRPPDGEPFSGHAFRVDLGEAELRLVPASGPSPRQTVEQIASPFPAVVAVNASFFDNDGRAMGLAVSEGRLVATGKRASWGALVISGTDARIVLGSGISDPLAHRLIIQVIPRLVVGGAVPGLKPHLAERTAVCAAANRFGTPRTENSLGLAPWISDVTTAAPSKSLRDLLFVSDKSSTADSPSPPLVTHLLGERIPCSGSRARRRVRHEHAFTG